MRFKVVALAVWVVLAGLSGAHAQSLSQIGGPRELPPPGFKGQQYVDSRGCVFLRAGFGGEVAWVPRVDQRRKPMCGQTPSFGAQPATEIAEEVAPVAAPVVAPVVAAAEPVATVKPARVVIADPGPPMETVASLPAETRPTATRVVIPVVVSAPAPDSDRRPTQGYQTAASGVGSGQIGCYASVPVAERVMLSNGRTAVVCTRGDGGASGWRSPIYPADAGVGASLGYAQATAVAATTGTKAAAARVAVSDAVPTPPKGYRLAWRDDRLNPMRGKGTAAGQAAQDQVWSREVPARQIASLPVVRQSAAPQTPAPQTQVTRSTKTAPTQPVAVAATGALYVQVGTFGVPENAAGASARLAALGLPVSKAKLSKGGKQLQIVYAGPFGSAAAAAAGLTAARQAGFADAFIR